MSAILEKEGDDPEGTKFLKVAIQNLLEAFRENLDEFASPITERKTELAGKETTSPFTHYESKRELLRGFINVVNQVVQPYELETVFTDFLLDEMLPSPDTSAKGEL